MSKSSKTYRSQKNDMVDKVCHDFYGSHAPLAAVLSANRGLADYGPLLPSGVLITLPDLIAPAQQTAVKLWD